LVGIIPNAEGWLILHSMEKIMDNREEEDRHLKQGLRHLGTPRDLRARRYAQYTMAIMRDFLPSHRFCLRTIEDHLWQTAYDHNLETIEVPPECDEFDRLMLERRMLETKIATIPADDMPPLGDSRPPVAG
jgi:hypothetical protein